MTRLNAVIGTPVLAVTALSAQVERPTAEEIKKFREALEGHMSRTLPELLEYCARPSRPR